MHDKPHGAPGMGQSQGPGTEDPGFQGAPNQWAGGYGPAFGHYGAGPGPHGPAMHHGPGPGPFSPGPEAPPPWGGSQGPGFAYGPPPGAYGPPPPGWGPYPPGYGPQQPFGPDPAAAAGLSAAMNEIADQSGLGALKGFLNFNDGEFWKGAMVGAAIVLLMTNDELRNALLGSAAKTANAMKAGMAGFGAESAEDADGQGTDPAAEKEQGR